MIDSAVEKREMERKHAAIQQRVRPCSPGRPPEGLRVHCPSPRSMRGPGGPSAQTRAPSLPRLTLIFELQSEAGVPTLRVSAQWNGHLDASASPLSPQRLQGLAGTGLQLGRGSYCGHSWPGAAGGRDGLRGGS